MQKTEWFVNWFNSTYYHLLYNHRNYDEAKVFIDNLCEKLRLTQEAKIWDLACGMGRHSLALSKKGYRVTGTDLSQNNILEARKNENDHLRFFEHDMREHFMTDHFNAVFNLFTSIGYFDNYADNYLVFKYASQALQPEGFFVVDFFNAKKVINSLKPLHVEQRGEIVFEIRKTIDAQKIKKCIEFKDHGKRYHFEENVSLLTKTDFELFAAEAGLTLVDTYGNYHLNDFNEEHSDRLILIFKK